MKDLKQFINPINESKKKLSEEQIVDLGEYLIKFGSDLKKYKGVYYSIESEDCEDGTIYTLYDKEEGNKKSFEITWKDFR